MPGQKIYIYLHQHIDGAPTPNQLSWKMDFHKRAEVMNTALYAAVDIEKLYVMNTIYTVTLEMRKCCSCSGQFTIEELPGVGPQ